MCERPPKKGRRHFSLRIEGCYEIFTSKEMWLDDRARLASSLEHRRVSVRFRFFRLLLDGLILVL